MRKKITWEKMKSDYPDEWLLIVDYELDNYGHIMAGIVERHSRNKDEVYRLPSLNKSTAFRYTGISNFSGLRSHAENRNVV
jgi:hypothetical protein